MTPVIDLDYGKMLNEAREVLHRISMGGAVRVYVDQNGERVEYSAANRDKLIAYISFLEGKCGIGGPKGPLTPFF